MKKRVRSKRKTLPTKYSLLILTGVCVTVFLLSLTLNISGGPLNTVAGYVFIPMQNGINETGNWISTRANEFKTLGEVLKDNKKLQAQVDDLTSELTTMKLEQYDVDSLRELLDLDEKYPDYKKVAASVIAKDSGNWFDTFTINKGTRDGIDVDMNVMAGCGLVGIVTDVGPNYAQVRSIINDTSNVSAMITSTGDNFIVSGNLKTMNDSRVITFSELKDEEDQVNIGDPVVTSYVSDQYQQGILIGYITTIEENANNLTKSGSITPVVDFEHLKEVLVVLDKKENGDSSASPKKKKNKQESTESDTQISTEDSIPKEQTDEE